MVDFNQVAIIYVMLLVGINTFFAAAVTLPGDQFGDPTKTLFSDIKNNPDLNKSMFTYVDTIQADTNTVTVSDVNTTISVQQGDIISVLFNIGNTLTGGGLGYVTKFVSFLTQMAFGYGIWIDYFFNPAWGPFVSILGGIVKGTMFIIELFGLVAIFMSLVGRRF